MQKVILCYPCYPCSIMSLERRLRRCGRFTRILFGVKINHAPNPQKNNPRNFSNFVLISFGAASGGRGITPLHSPPATALRSFCCRRGSIRVVQKCSPIWLSNVVRFLHPAKGLSIRATKP